MIKGLEIFLKSLSSNLVSGQDVIVAVFHLLLVHEDYKCLGTGTQFNLNEDTSRTSELLPENWCSQREQSYSLKYVHKDGVRKLIFRFDFIGCTWIANFVLEPGHYVVEFDINPSYYVTENLNSYESIFVSSDSPAQLYRLFYTKVIAAFNHSRENISRLREGGMGIPANESQPYRPHHVPGQAYGTSNYGRPVLGTPRIGGADLSPFGTGSGGGGMLFDPRDPSHFPESRYAPDFGYLPPGAIPPGSRFEAIFPNPSLDSRRPPRGPRSFGPPGYDDMFM